MAFPTIQTADTKNGVVTTNSNSWTLIYPTNIAAGDLLIAFVAADGFPSLTWPANWVGIGATSGGAAVVLAVRYKIALGSESGTFTVSLDATEQGAWRIFRITGWHGTTPPDSASIDGGGSSQFPDPPNLNASWGAADNLWFASCGVDTSRTISVYPYPDNQTADVSGGSGGATLGLCTKNLNASSDNPGTFTISASDDWAVETVVVRPAASVASGWGALLSDKRNVAIVQ